MGDVRHGVSARLGRQDSDGVELPEPNVRKVRFIYSATSKDKGATSLKIKSELFGAKLVAALVASYSWIYYKSEE